MDLLGYGQRALIIYDLTVDHALNVNRLAFQSVSEIGMQWFGTFLPLK
jgi:hypothetical protein